MKIENLTHVLKHEKGIKISKPNKIFWRKNQKGCVRSKICLRKKENCTRGCLREELNLKKKNKKKTFVFWFIEGRWRKKLHAYIYMNNLVYFMWRRLCLETEKDADRSSIHEKMEHSLSISLSVSLSLFLSHT